MWVDALKTGRSSFFKLYLVSTFLCSVNVDTLLGLVKQMCCLDNTLILKLHPICIATLLYRFVYIDGLNLPWAVKHNRLTRQPTVELNTYWMVTWFRCFNYSWQMCWSHHTSPVDCWSEQEVWDPYAGLLQIKLINCQPFVF